MLTIGLVAIENAISSSLTAPLDIFGVSNVCYQKLHDETHPFCEAEIITPHASEVKDFHGRQLRQTSEKIDSRYDIIIIPAIYGDITPSITDRSLITWVRDQHQRGACIATVCAGAFVAAQAGLLNGRKATTHWALANEFTRLFPQVHLHAERILIDEGDVITAGGVTSYLDLCLHLLHRFGSLELATDIARTFLIDNVRQDQLPYTVSSFPKHHGDEQILTSQNWLEDNCAEAISTSEMAAIAGLENRTFTRRFKKATGVTPTYYLQSLRIDTARRLLERTTQPFDWITREIGYEDFSSFRRLFMKHTGLTPSAYRKRFSIMYTERKRDAER